MSTVPASTPDHGARPAQRPADEPRTTSGGQVDTAVVAVLTFRRPQHLVEIVPNLCEQLDSAAGLYRKARVLVVDNDPDAGARDFVTGFGDPRVRYVHEPQPGIAAARNAALDDSQDADVLVFVDDDERPTAPWLRSLLTSYLNERPAGVVGPILCVFDQEPEPWIKLGGFFDRRRMPSGTPVSVAATNNLLLDLEVVRRLGLRFDERFAQIGGSDHMFTKQLTDRGERLIWDADALVHDRIPAGRLTREWVKRRAYRIGASASLIEVDQADGLTGKTAARARQSGSGLLRVAGGGVRYLRGTATRSVREQANGVRNISRGMGLIAGSFGRGYPEYSRQGKS